MGTVTVSFEKDDEDRLRRLAHEKYNGRKGALSKVLSEGLRKLDEEENRLKAFESLKRKMEKGYDMGKIMVKHRAELYDR